MTGLFILEAEWMGIEFDFAGSTERRPSRYSERVGGRLGEGLGGRSVVVGSGGAAVTRPTSGEDSAHPVHVDRRSSEDVSVRDL